MEFSLDDHRLIYWKNEKIEKFYEVKVEAKIENFVRKFLQVELEKGLVGEKIINEKNLKTEILI